MPSLNWIGKQAVVKHHKEVPLRLLEPVAELGCGANQGRDSGNLIVQGDNLHAPKALYLLYNGILEDRSAAGVNVLTGPVFDALPRFAGPKVIYAAANRMGGRAAREGISFKQTPYALEL